MATVVGGAALGWFTGKLITKLVSFYIKRNPKIIINAVRKYEIDTATKLSYILGINVFNYMKSGLIVSFVTQQYANRKMSLNIAKLLYKACRSKGVKIVLDGPHKCPYNFYHLHLGNGRLGHIRFTKAAIDFFRRML